MPGFAGDRAYAVVDAATGKVGSAKHPRLWGALLQCEARYVATPRAGAPLPPVSITLPNGDETGSDDRDVDERLSAVFGRPVQLTTVAPEGNRYLAVWPEIDGVIPDDFLAQSAVEGDEAEGTLTDLSLALASPPGTFFDVAALHVLTTATLRRLGELEPTSRFAVERYRPNIVDRRRVRAVRGERLERRDRAIRRCADGVGADPDHALHHDDPRAGRAAPRRRRAARRHAATTGSRSPASARGRASARTPTVGTPGPVQLGDDVAIDGVA